MPVTRAQADAELVDRCGGLLTFAGRPVTTDGTNSAMIGPLREGLSSLGYSPSSYGAITDADLAQVPDSGLEQLIDVAELRLKRSTLGWMTKVDQRLSMAEQKFGQVRVDLKTEIAELEARLKNLYGYGLGTVFAGRVDLGFAQTDPCETDPIWPEP